MALEIQDVPQMIQPSVPLLSLVEGQGEQSVIVRLLRSWEVRNFKQKGALLSCDMLLLDEKDTTIQASIYHRRLPKFKGLFKEGKVYCLSQFDVAPSFPKLFGWDNIMSPREDNQAGEESEEVIKELKDVGQQLALAFNPEGSVLAAGADCRVQDGTLRVFK